MGFEEDLSGAAAIYGEVYSRALDEGLGLGFRLFDALEDACDGTADAGSIEGAVLSDPTIVAALRLSCAPPLSRDRLAQIASIDSRHLRELEEGRLPKRNDAFSTVVTEEIPRICEVFLAMLDGRLAGMLPGNPGGLAPCRRAFAGALAERFAADVFDQRIRERIRRENVGRVCSWLDGNGYARSSDGGPSTYWPGRRDPSGVLAVSPSGRRIDLRCRESVSPQAAYRRAGLDGERLGCLPEDGLSAVCFILPRSAIEVYARRCREERADFIAYDDLDALHRLGL